jgi:hypothetical protein
MKIGTALVSGLGLGAGLMYLFDPDRGPRRRARIRSTVAAAQHRSTSAFGKAARDLNNRTAGVIAELRGAMSREEVDDDVLVARVASKLGHVVSHPHAIGVTVEDGVVILEGPILADEIDLLLKTVRRVRGVRDVDDRLDMFEEAGNVPSLQGGRPRTGPRIDILQHNWSPATRALAGAAGGALVVYGLARRDVVGTALGAIGVGLTARSLTNKELATLANLDSVRGSLTSKVGRNARAQVGFAARKLQSFVESGHEDTREELH